MIFIKWLLIITLLIVIAIVLAVLAGQLGMLKGIAPADLGVHEGKLKPPAMTPNSVSSQATLYPDHPQLNYASIEPLPLIGDAATTMARIRSIIEGMEGTEVITSDEYYLYVQFTTRIMKFVDDAEFWFDPVAHVIQVRSASRLGKSDLGMNRKRIEAIRAQLESS
ncbi:DUF1499 domain-containing protein [Nitrosomonas sp. Nm58]|uniref:DUF1499 domain-containing protein n=1 Tax=Nitrosomonas sp. Nm58 TaxID=200126 RepID=UPI000894B51D|nr:DUF1499 domain-containing protein [Nitrosomonas sp. Nm58]SDY35092.1 Uncharacterized conserved protein, DUF1499 family [Nitrosomonas sp. Nm58]